jgi:hypothetical protein
VITGNMEVLFDELGVWDAWMVDIVNERWLGTALSNSIDSASS